MQAASLIQDGVLEAMMEARLESKRSISSEARQKDGKDMIVIEAQDNRWRDSIIVLTHDLARKPLTLVNTIRTCRYCHDHTTGVDYRI